jgi:hypothetical protein
MTSGSGQYEVQEAGAMIILFILVTHTPPGRLQTPNPTLLDKRNVETPYRSSQGDSLPQGKPMAVRAWDISECRTVMARIRVETSPGTKVSPRPPAQLLSLRVGSWSRSERTVARRDAQVSPDADATHLHDR